MDPNFEFQAIANALTRRRQVRSAFEAAAFEALSAIPTTSEREEGDNIEKNNIKNNAKNNIASKR